MKRTNRTPLAAAIAILLCVSCATLADPPPGYYDSVDATNSTTLRTTLHAVIDDHTRIRYPVGSQTDTWDVLELADEDPNNSDNILDVYKNASYEKFGGGNKFYEREHTWPSSYGFPNDGSGNYPFTDCHMLFLSDDSYNFSRGNTAYRNCDAACDGDCPQDLDGDGSVGAFDLAVLLGSWGPCEGCPADFNGDNVVNAADLAQLLGAWGPCEGP